MSEPVELLEFLALMRQVWIAHHGRPHGITLRIDFGRGNATKVRREVVAEVLEEESQAVGA